MVANGAPILIRIFLQGPRFNSPLDCNVKFFDGRPILGHSKTIRGFVTAILVTPVIAFMLGLSLQTGFVIALYSMFGDIFSSFLKRRLNLPPSSRAWILDQVPESLFPLLAIKQIAIQEQFTLPWPNIVLVVLVFLVLELFLSKLLYQLKIRKRPY